MLPACRIGEYGGEEGIVRERGQRVGKGAKKGRGSTKLVLDNYGEGW